MRAHQILEQAAQQWPDKVAIIENGIEISFRQLNSECSKLAKQLRQNGFLPGQGLAVVGSNGAAFIAAMLAGMANGGIVLPLSHQLKLAEIDTAIRTTGIHAVIDDGSGPLSGCRKSTAITFMQQSLAFSRIADSQEPLVDLGIDAAFIRYTSGTTGRSKGVVMSHNRILERLDAAQAALKLDTEDTVLWVLPMAFHFLVTIMLYIRYGVTIVICKDLLAQSLLQKSEKYRATFLYASPMHFRLLAADRSGMGLGSISRVISTSSAIPSSVADSFRQRYDVPVAQAYGIIEAGIPLLDTKPDLNTTESVGYPTPGFDVELLDNNGVSVGVGQTGQLAIRGPGMFDAYLSPWQRSEELMREGWFMTGDLARATSDGKIVICGREKSMINVAGNKAFPEEIEEVLNTFPGIRDSHVFGEPHPLMGEIVCAEIHLQCRIELDDEAVLQHCRKRLSMYKVPHKLYRVSTIQRTASGKIGRG